MTFVLYLPTINAVLVNWSIITLQCHTPSNNKDRISAQALYCECMLRLLRNGPDKNNSNNGNEHAILGDPGEDSGDEEKSKRAEKYMA